MDDGAADAEESLKLLKLLKDDGVDVVVATPHLYLHKQDMDGFIRKRGESANELDRAVKGGDYPQIVVGAEVYFSPALSGLPLKELCVAGTGHMMLELPCESFSAAFLNTLANFLSACEVNIILAHIERYFDYNKPEVMDEILSYGVLAQANCDSFEQARYRKTLFKLIKSGKVRLIGTDSHSAERRPPAFGKSERVIRKKLSDDTFEGLMKTAEDILYGKLLK
jgi:protein-tyrosine phosphatase